MTGAGQGSGSDAADSLLEVLAEARRAGFLGPGSLDLQIRHGAGFVVVARGLTEADPATRAGTGRTRSSRPRLVDLGSGGGVPGLVVAHSWPEVELALLEASRRRCEFLRRSIAQLGFDGRVSVLEGRAEELGRDPDLRGTFDGAFARSFGKPAVVAECAAPLLRPGGWLVVSEPPADGGGITGTARPERQRERWPADELGRLGLEPGVAVTEEFEYQTLRQALPCPPRFPRRNGVPAKRPLF